MLSLRSSKSDQQLSSFFVTTMVDWDMPSRVDKLENKIKKVMKKHLKLASVSANRINTFLVIEANLKAEPKLDTRKTVEAKIKEVLSGYADRLNQTYRKDLIYNGDSDIYYDAFQELGVYDIYKPVLYNRRHGLIDDIEDKVEEIISTASLMMWDVPGHGHDRIILPDVVTTMDDLDGLDQTQLDAIPEMSDLIDELIIANFAGYFLPYAETILRHALVGIDQLRDKLDNNQGFGELPMHAERALRNFIGSISGLQESLKMLTREVKRLCDVVVEIEEEISLYPSSQLHDWVQSLRQIDCPKIQQAISTLNDRITEVKPELRLLLKGSGESDTSLEVLFTPMIELKAVSAAIVQFASQFDDIPSFTTLSDGIAFESVENEVYEKSHPDALLEVTKLFKMYRRGGSTVYALRGVDFAIHAGDFVVIQGPSGSGKTTLLNMLAGLDTPDRGAVFFEDTDINQLRDGKRSKVRRENFSFIFQSYALIPHLDAYENVALPIEMGGLSRDLKDNIQTLLDDVGIGEYADHKPSHLSGGQMQRLGIARALANNPSIIFADEPTGDLDEKTGRKVMELLKKYHEETGVTIVLVTHNPEIAKYGSRQVNLEDGQITNTN